MFYTLIIDSSNPQTGEFKKSRSVNTTPVISSVFLYLYSFFVGFFFLAQLWNGYVLIQSIYSINIYLTYNPNMGLRLRGGAVFTSQHEASLSLKKHTGMDCREMTNYKRYSEQNMVDSRRKDCSRELQDSNHFLAVKSNSKFLRCTAVSNVVSYFCLGISFPSYLYALSLNVLPLIFHSLTSGLFFLFHIYCGRG